MKDSMQSPAALHARSPVTLGWLFWGNTLLVGHLQKLNGMQLLGKDNLQS